MKQVVAALPVSEQPVARDWVRHARVGRVVYQYAVRTDVTVEEATIPPRLGVGCMETQAISGRTVVAAQHELEPHTHLQEPT